MDRATLLRYLARILIIALTLYLAWLYLPGKSDLGNVSHTTQNQKIAIIPTGNIPLRFLQNLESRLEEQHGVDVLVTTEMGLSEGWIFPEQNQYNANYLAAYGKQILDSLRREGMYGIVLTNEDMNFPDSGLRFVFSANYEGVSVVSLARINPANIGVTVSLISLPVVFDMTTTRALKLINKSLGRALYGYEVSNNRSSVMYGPIMSLSDLDSVGDWYE
jgi:predicted Zn-dependent protease